MYAKPSEDMAKDDEVRARNLYALPKKAFLSAFEGSYSKDITIYYTERARKTTSQNPPQNQNPHVTATNVIARETKN